MSVGSARLSRRVALGAAAWSVPALAVAGAAPALASSCAGLTVTSPQSVNATIGGSCTGATATPNNDPNPVTINFTVANSPSAPVPAGTAIVVSFTLTESGGGTITPGTMPSASWTATTNADGTITVTGVGGLPTSGSVVLPIIFSSTGVPLHSGKVTAVLSSTEACAPSTTQTILGAKPYPDLRPSVVPNSTKTANVTSVVYRVDNIGMADTTGSFNVWIYNPTAGTLTIPTTGLPTDWSYVIRTGSYTVLKYAGVVKACSNVSITFSYSAGIATNSKITFRALVTKDATNQSGEENMANNGPNSADSIP